MSKPFHFDVKMEYRQYIHTYKKHEVHIGKHRCEKAIRKTGATFPPIAAKGKGADMHYFSISHEKGATRCRIAP
jgi:hypothetical protein